MRLFGNAPRRRELIEPTFGVPSVSNTDAPLTWEQAARLALVVLVLVLAMSAFAPGYAPPPPPPPQIVVAPSTGHGPAQHVEEVGGRGAVHHLHVGVLDLEGALWVHVGHHVLLVVHRLRARVCAWGGSACA